MLCQVQEKGGEFVKDHLICSLLFFSFFFLVSMEWGLVGNDGSTFLVGLSHFWYSGLWDLLKGIEEYTNICIFIYVYFFGLNVI